MHMITHAIPTPPTPPTTPKNRLVRIQPRLCTAEELTRFHTPEYVAKIEKMSKENGGEAGDFAHFSKVGDFNVCWLGLDG